MSSPGSGRLALFPPAPGRGLGPAAAASSSRCTQSLWAQLLGMSAESRMPLAGSPEPGQTSGLHWACSRGARREGRGRCRGSYGNCWARTRPRGAAGGAAAWCALGSAPRRAHTHARTPGRRHTRGAGLQPGVPVCVRAPRLHGHGRTQTNTRTDTPAGGPASARARWWSHRRTGRSAAGSPGIGARPKGARACARTRPH